MRRHRAQQHQRGHAEGDAVLRAVDFFDQQIVAGLDVAADAAVHPANRKAHQRHAQNQPTMLQPRVGGPIQRKQKQRRGRARQRANHKGDRQPARQIGQQATQFLNKGVIH